VHLGSPTELGFEHVDSHLFQPSAAEPHVGVVKTQLAGSPEHGVDVRKHPLVVCEAIGEVRHDRLESLKLLTLVLDPSEEGPSFPEQRFHRCVTYHLRNRTDALGCLAWLDESAICEQDSLRWQRVCVSETSDAVCRSRAMAFQLGVLPDDVIRDPESEAAFVFLTLDPSLDRAGAKTVLTDIAGTLTEFERKDPRQLGSAALGLGPSFFAPGGTPRFGLEGRTPVGLGASPQVAAPDTLAAADVVLYAMTPQEGHLADLLKALSRLRGRGLTGASVERGFQRHDGRELFGHRDGLRNVPWRARYRTVFVDRVEQPDEPDWTEDGTYLAYLKIRQDFDAWARLSDADKEQIVGRRLADGSRLDLPPGTNPHTEGDYVGDPPSPSSHVRKSGPRGGHDDLAIFRRGVPYFGLGPDGSAQGGLHFASFQASLRQFEVVFAEWISDPNFPAANTGVDQLFARGLVTVERAGFFFVPPADSRFLGAGAFDAPRQEPAPRNSGRLLVRKRAVDQSGAPIRADLDAVGFQVFKPDGTAVGDVFETNSAGHATSGDLPVRQDLILREVRAPDRFEPSPDTSFRLERRRQVQEVVNRLRTSANPYGG
jgi:deferrochelatase/peroxidase EfeB